SDPGRANAMLEIDGGSLTDPVLNGPYDLPSQYFEMGPKGPTGRILEGRRPSESFIPVAPVKKRGAKAPDASEQLALSLTHEIVQPNSLINDLRLELMRWHTSGYEGVTATSRKLLLHWADSERENRILFAQREAAETAIFLAEVAGRHRGFKEWRT